MRISAKQLLLVGPQTGAWEISAGQPEATVSVPRFTLCPVLVPWLWLHTGTLTDKSKLKSKWANCVTAQGNFPKRSHMLIVIGCSRTLQWGQTILKGTDAVSSNYCNFMLRVPGYCLALRNSEKYVWGLILFCLFLPFFFFYFIYIYIGVMYPDQNPSVRGDNWMKGEFVNRICKAKLVPVAFAGSILCSFE